MVTLGSRASWSFRGLFAVFSRKKQWTGARLAGFRDVSVFGEFVEYARQLGYSEEPDYGCWKDRFRRLVPSTSDDLLYDPSHNTAPPLKAIVTQWTCQVMPTVQTTKMDLSIAPSSSCRSRTHIR